MFKVVFRGQAGGLFYHLRAQFHSRSLWNSFRTHLQKSLTQKTPPHVQTAILVGASGGYCLTTTYLSQFKKIIVVDPDPYAQFFFKRRFPTISVQWLQQDAFNFQEASFKLLQELYQREQQAVLIFCNVLGQVPFLKGSPYTKDSVQLQKWQINLRQFLINKNWISFHDRLSASTTNTDCISLWSSPQITDQDLAHQFSLQNRPVFAHLTEQLFPDGQRDYLSWALTPKSTHVIECVGSQST